MSVFELKQLYPEECALIFEAGRYYEIYQLRERRKKRLEAEQSAEAAASR